MNKILYPFFIMLISCSSQGLLRESNLVQETNLKQSITDMDFNTAVNLLADDNVKKAIQEAKVVDVNGFKILFSEPNEIFIIRDKNVLARINHEVKIFYRSTMAPLSGEEVYLKDNLLIYNNKYNSFIDYGIDGVDVIERNYLNIINTTKNTSQEILPNTPIINHQKCQTLEDMSRAACCGKTGYAFTWEHGWAFHQKVTEKCQ